MDTTPANPPTGPQRDPCWHCGYDLSNLDTTTCPECGSYFAAGKDLRALHRRLLGGESRRCARCGTEWVEAGLTRCHTCGMRFSHNPEESDPAEAARGGARGTVAAGPLASSGGPRRRRIGTRALLIVVGVGQGAAVAMIVMAQRAASSLPEAAGDLLRAGGLVISGVLMVWLVVHFIRPDLRDAGRCRDGRCPRCKYDTRGLTTKRCPECGEWLPDVEP